MSAVANTALKLVWTIVALIIIATLGHYLYSRTQPERQSSADRRVQTSIQKPIPWHEVDAAIVGALKSSHTKAEDIAKARLGEWTGELQKRIDADFLKWYFSYWHSSGWASEPSAIGSPTVWSLKRSWANNQAWQRE